MSSYTPPTPEEVAQNHDPAWLRLQADKFEEQAGIIAESLRKRADVVELALKINAMSKDQSNIFRAKDAMINRGKVQP
jgi:hypothetical protein